MARRLAVTQFIYKYADENDTSEILKDKDLNNVDFCQLLDGVATVSIGVQAPSGTRMLVNGQTATVGPTGIFELDNIVEISSFKIIPTTYLRKVIIDILYDKGE